MGLRTENPLRFEDKVALVAFVHGQTKRGYRIQSKRRKLIYVDSIGAAHVVAMRANGRISFSRTCSIQVLRLQVQLESLLTAIKSPEFPEDGESKQASD